MSQRRKSQAPPAAPTVTLLSEVTSHRCYHGDTATTDLSATFCHVKCVNNFSFRTQTPALPVWTWFDWSATAPSTVLEV